MCGDPNSVLRFAFVEFTDEGEAFILLNLFISSSFSQKATQSYAFEYPTDGAGRALSLAGTMLGFYPVKVLPSKTAIIPVNPTFLPQVIGHSDILFLVFFTTLKNLTSHLQSEDEREMCARTVYCTNIDKKVNFNRLYESTDT